MSHPRIYMDYNATAPVLSKVKETMMECLDVVGNPSSVHYEGRKAKQYLENARLAVAQSLCATPEEIIFTSGGTESNNIGLIGLAYLAQRLGKNKSILLPPIEHPCIVGTAEFLREKGFTIEPIVVDTDGKIDIDSLEKQCRNKPSVMAFSWANHEIGTIQDMETIVTMAHDHQILVHCDAVAAFGKLPQDMLDLQRCPIDTMSISGHKIGAPWGVGALRVRQGIDITAIVEGGKQEYGRRPGTQNLLGIVGLGQAASMLDTMIVAYQQLISQRTLFEKGLLALDGVSIYAEHVDRLPNTINACFHDLQGDILVASLDIEGIAVSAGAACSSGMSMPSPVLVGLGVNKEKAQQSVRFSLGTDNQIGDIHRTLKVLSSTLSRIRNINN